MKLVMSETIGKLFMRYIEKFGEIINLFHPNIKTFLT